MAADAQSSQSDERLTSLSRSARFAAVDARQAITPVTVPARPRLSVARMVMLTSVMTLARSLGVERAVIFHVDDVGMCHAQIERARSAGIRPTHIDAHMARRLCCPTCSTATSGLGTTTASSRSCPARFGSRPIRGAMTPRSRRLNAPGCRSSTHSRHPAGRRRSRRARLPHARRRASRGRYAFRRALRRAGRCRGHHAAARAVADQRICALRIGCCRQVVCGARHRVGRLPRHPTPVASRSIA